MISRVLVTLDGSALAEEILPHAFELVRSLKSEVHFVRVVSPSATIVPVDSPEMAVANAEVSADLVEAEIQGAEAYLQKLQSQWREQGVDAKYEVLRGAPAPAIIEYAKTHAVDLVAMSTHGRSGLSRLIFGSVAERVLRDVGVPVIAVRPKGQHERQT